MVDMEPRSNIESLLQTGYFTTSRASQRSPPPSDSPRSSSPSGSAGRYYSSAYPPPPPPPKHREIPRYVPQRPRPPPPSCEDEEESLLKEHGSTVSTDSDVTPSRGHVDQYPIIEEVHEHNPERRFVLVPGSEDPSKDSKEPSKEAARSERRRPEKDTDKSTSSPTKDSQTRERERDRDRDRDRIDRNRDRERERERERERDKDREREREREKGRERERERERERPRERERERGRDWEKERDKDYPANTTRKYDTLAPDNVPNGSAQPSLERRRSRQDLPRIDTEMSKDQQPAPTRDTHRRSKSSVREERPPPDYFSPSTSKRTPTTRDDLLSPKVITHATGGREKVYYDYSRGQQKPLRSERSRSNIAGDRRGDEAYTRTTQTASPAASKRPVSMYEDPRMMPSSAKERSADSSRYRDDHERRREKRDSYARRESPTRSRDTRNGSDGRNGSSSSADDSLKAPPSNSRQRRRSTVIHDDRPYLQTPTRDQHAGSSTRSRSRAPTSPVPMPSPKFADNSFKDGYIPPSPRASGTFPTTTREKRESKETSLPYPEEDFLPKTGSLSFQEPGERRGTRSRSRAPPSLPTAATVGATVGAAAALPSLLPTLQQPETDTPVERKRSPAPSVAEARASAPQFHTSQDNSWPPPAFDPDKNNLAVERPAGSYRRYSEDTSKAGSTVIPECPRRKGVAGKTDWLGLFRCSNFVICPDCYTAVFSGTEFRQEFMPLPFRPADKPIACDFGSSPWYRIAWLLTLKNQQPDLRLFHQIANVAAIASAQPCPGTRSSVRVWYSIRDPYKQATIPDFTICYECSKTVEVLLPNLTGVFVPLHASAVPSRGSCDMHFHAERRRFVLYFDALETTSDQALSTSSAPNLGGLAKTIEKLSLFTECHEDSPVPDKNWHIMQYLPEFTVCGDCFDAVVRPRLADGGHVARNFYLEPQRMPVATCQLYSKRMRDIFRKACRHNDPKYLESRVLERQKVEADIHAKLRRLDQLEQSEWADKEVERLIAEWREWE